MRRTDAGGRHGAALLVTLGAVVVLSVLGLAFARLSALESQASATRVDEVRARLAASAGIEHALSAIRAASTRPWDSPDAAWFYRGHAGLAAGNGVPLEEATLPSYLAGSTADWNEAIAAAGQGKPYSGIVSGTYEPAGDTYVLRVLDATSMIDLNAPSDPRRPRSEEPLVRMLASLSRALDAVEPPLSPAEAEEVLAYRDSLPSRRFDDERDLLRMPGRPVTERDLELLDDFVTCHAWRDPAVLAPVPDSSHPPAGSLVRGRTPTGAPRLEARSPIDVNTAPSEVLTAVFAGLSAVVVDEEIPRDPAGGAAWQARGRAARTRPVSFDQAARLARALALRRETAPIRTWTEFRDLLDMQVRAGDLEASQAEAILAMADPNTDTHRANPDLPVYRRIDKFDLVATTTEICFASMGVFEIESIGRVTAEGGIVRARARIETAVEVYSIVRHTSQAQFLQGEASTYDLVEPTLYALRVAILTEESIVVNGSVEILGQGGSIHSNADLELLGTTYVQNDATAGGTYSQGPQCRVGGVSGGSYPRQDVPLVSPTRFRSAADFVFSASGKVYDASGRLVGDGSFMGFEFHDGDWNWRSGPTLSGTLYFEGNVSIRSNTPGSGWTLTVVATGHIALSGTPKVKPDASLRFTLIAGTDISVSGNPGAVIEGVLYAGEQFELDGSVEFFGGAMAKGLGDSDAFLRANGVGGSVVCRYDGLYLVPIVLETLTLPTLVTFPEPDAEIDQGPSRLHLPAAEHADGWISLAPVTTSRIVLGAVPYRDRLLARWTRESLDADLGGGPLAPSLDTLGPMVAPIVSAGAPGALLPDGLHSEVDAVPAFVAPGNVGPLRGTIAFWLKPSWDPNRAEGPSNRTHHLLALSRSGESGTQSFQLARVGDWTPTWSGTFGFQFERSEIENPRAERLLYSRWAPPPHRWTHFAVMWDFIAEGPRQGIAVYVDGMPLPEAVAGFLDAYALSEDELLAAPITPGNLLRLGERLGADYGLPGSSAEATYDELVSLPVAAGPDLPAALYLAGRYYSGGNAAYVSAPLPIPRDSSVLWASFTVREPREWEGPRVSLVLSDRGVTFAAIDEPAGVSVGQRIQGEVRYGLVFQGPPPERPLYESPAVDDVTVAFSRAPQILRWEES
ncbi:MAG: hypothetical protein HY720_16190 [Planctomycetes bacterium]|nr:hypothetical protein [Planctomycetota bacterium]